MKKQNRIISAGALLLASLVAPACVDGPLADQTDTSASALAVSVNSFVNFNAAAFELPEGLAVDKNGDFRVAIAFSGEIKKVTKTGVVSSFAQLPGPHTGFSAVGLALDSAQNVYVARATFNAANTGVYRISADGSTVTQFAQLPVGIPNGLAFDEEGTLYVSDSMAGTIWRIDSAGNASIWVQDALLAGESGPPLNIPVGANGIAFDKGQKNLYVAVTDKGRIVRIPRNHDSGAAGTPAAFVENLALLKGADGIAFDVKSNLYVAVNRQDRLVRISSSGATQVLAEGGLLDFPATPAFGRGSDNKTLFLTNFALFRARGFVPGTPSPKIVKLNIGIEGAELGED